VYTVSLVVIQAEHGGTFQEQSDENHGQQNSIHAHMRNSHDGWAKDKQEGFFSYKSRHQPDTKIVSRRVSALPVDSLAV